MFPILHIGPLAIQSPELILVIGLWIGLYFAAKQVKNFGITATFFENTLFTSIFIGLVGARLFYLFQYPDVLFENMWSIFSLNITMLHLQAGIFSAVVAYLAMFQRKRVSLWAALDALTLVISIEIVAVFISLLASGEWFGIPTSLPWGIKLWNQNRHPTQIYGLIIASIVAFFLFFGILPFVKRNFPRFQGGISLVFGMLTPIYLILVDSFIANPIYFLDRIHLTQIGAWISLFISSLFFQKRIIPELVNFFHVMEKKNES